MSTIAAKRVKEAFHSLQVNNELLHLENEQLRHTITTKKRKKKHNKVLDLQQHQEYQSLAVIWSPRAVREARERDAIQQQEEAAAKLQKEQDREARAAAAACRKQLQAEAKAEREVAKIARAKEREARAAQLAAARARKAEERAAATAKKLRDTQNKAVRKVSSSQKSKVTKRGGVAAAQSSSSVAEPIPKPLPKTTTRGRNIKLPKKYE